ncbi:dihydroorotase [mine drainage metagenome]|uniref:Dihydroorotase n=1 Tax=mine drainage metagenome TaxID=410659 RepID=A0A1J5RIS0_9ZZZZ
MKILLKKVLIADANSPFDNTSKDILIDDGKIISIKDKITEKADTTIEEELTVSPGWIDSFSHFCDPGYEFKETIETGAAAAIAGGFTHVFVLPNTLPVVQSKSQVEYIVQKSKSLGITIHPLGTVTKNIEGKDLAEMYDMHASGAIAFSDGLNPVQIPGLFLKALQYVKAFDGILIQMPIDKTIGTHGLINEGIISTQLGLPGIPAIAEEIMIKRDIELVRYTNSKLHLTGISTEKSIELIKAAKAEGLQISCSVTPYHLFFCDEDLLDYDTNLKVNPPLRSKADMLALRKAVMAGTIDCIASHHMPQNWDNKTCEFEYAKYGMIGLETSFAVVNHVLPELTDRQLINLFSTNARNIFKIASATIEEGANAELTLFNRNKTSLLTKENIKSKSNNTPFINKELKGKVVGIINKGQLFLN